MAKAKSLKVLISANNYIEKGAPRNKISTTKYTWWNFLPLFLWEQFKQFQNIYYLLNAIAGYFVPLIEPIANVIPLVFVLVMACVRELIEDISKKIQDNEQNGRLYVVVRNKKKMVVRANMICQGDLLVLKPKEECPCDCLVLQTQETGGTAFVSTSCLDGETTLKPKYVIFHTEDQDKLEQQEFIISTDQPNGNLAEFNGQVNEQYFTINNVILRGARLESQYQVLLAVMFVGKQTKMMYKQQKPKQKGSQLQTYMYNVILYQVILSLLLSIIFPLVSILTQKQFRNHYITFAAEPITTGVNFLEKFITYFILLAYFIPVSFFVSLEVSRLVGSMQFDNDRKLQIPEFVMEMKKKGKRKDKNAESLLDTYNIYQLSSQTRNITSIENLADIETMFVDKTGTLTKNDMIFKDYYSIEQKNSKFDGHIYDSTMLFGVGLCNSVLVVNNTFQAEFPDELALCKAAENSGLKLIIRQKQNIIYQYSYKIDQQTITIPIQFTQHAIIEFTSDRKRMSIVLQENGVIYSDSKEQNFLIQNSICQLEADHLYFVPTSITQPGKPFIITKGADNVVEKIMTQQTLSVYHDDIQSNLHAFSIQGLRTLLFATRQLDDSDMLLIHQWQEIIQSQDSYERACQQLENNLKFVGVSAVEDQLQKNVPETLNSFIKAGIRIWMLTGDKTETAINVGYSAGLITNLDEIFMLTQQTYKTQSELNNLLEGYMDIQEKMMHPEQRAAYSAKKNAILKRSKGSSCYQFSCKYMNKTIKDDDKTRSIVIMDNVTFENIMKYNYTPKLYVLMQFAKAGICCRLLSYQKSQIVKYCHQYLQHNTVAVGDGGNDILMIQEARTGIGIAGKEGLHACNNANITMPNFSFLRRMVFVYGHLFHIRNTELFEYVIEKNCVIAYAHVIYSFFNLFSVQVIMDSFLLLLFNVFITVFPIFFQAFSEIDVDIAVLEENSNIYRLEPLKYRPNVKYFIFRTLNSIYISAVMILGSRYMNQNTITFSSGHLNDINSEAYLQFISMLFIISIQFVLHQNFYTYFTLSSLIITIFGTVFTTWVGSYTNFFGIMLLGVPQQCSLQASFHLRYFILTIIGCIPSVIYEVIKRLYYPSISDLYRFKYNDSNWRCVDPYKKTDGIPQQSRQSQKQQLLKHKYYTVDVFQEKISV